jgi:hypothetical protein
MKSFIRSFFITFTLFLMTFGHAQFSNHKKVTGNGNLSTKTIEIPPYDHIKSVGFMDVKLIQGKEGEITVKTDENLHEWIEIKVKKNTLILDIKDNVNIHTKKGVHITVPFEEISGVSLVGSGDIDLTIHTSIVKAKVTGSGDMTLSGSTDALQIHVKGSGYFDGESLTSNRTDVFCTGSGDAVVVANTNLNAKIHGSGDIEYKGTPSQKDVRIFGSVDVDQRTDDFYHLLFKLSTIGATTRFAVFA